MKYFITGFPGSGKTTLSEALRKKGYIVYDVDQEKQLTKWVNKHTGETVAGAYVGTPEFYDNHDFHWDRKELKRLLNNACDRPVFICGLTSNQTEDLDLFTRVFLLKADQELLRKRMIDRKSIDATKQDEDVDHGFSWHKAFEEEMVKHGAVKIDASLPLEEVVLEIEKHIEYSI